MSERLYPPAPPARADSLSNARIMTANSTPSPLDQAILLAVDAHRGQFDKAGAPYILHPLRVMLAQPEDTRRMAAVLHDVVEDCGIAMDDLRARFGDGVADAVDALTKRPGEDYEAFIARCVCNPVARDVKRADIADNLDLSRLPAVTPQDEERAAKYRRALVQIDAADGAG